MLAQGLFFRAFRALTKLHTQPKKTRKTMTITKPGCAYISQDAHSPQRKVKMLQGTKMLRNMGTMFILILLPGWNTVRGRISRSFTIGCISPGPCRGPSFIDIAGIGLQGASLRVVGIGLG